KLPGNVVVTAALDCALEDAEIVVAAVPSHGCRAVMHAAEPDVPSAATIVSATKGLEPDTLLRMSEVIHQEFGGSRAVVTLSGPSFAVEVARQLPTAIVAASTNSVAT